MAYAEPLNVPSCPNRHPLMPVSPAGPRARTASGPPGHRVGMTRADEVETPFTSRKSWSFRSPVSRTSVWMIMMRLCGTPLYQDVEHQGHLARTVRVPPCARVSHYPVAVRSRLAPRGNQPKASRRTSRLDSILALPRTRPGQTTQREFTTEYGWMV